MYRYLDALRPLYDYRKELDNYADLLGVILEAAFLMQIWGHSVNKGLAFAVDVLRIKVNTGLHLTVVDYKAALT